MYQPTEQDKSIAAVVQFLAMVLFFLPGWIVGQTSLSFDSPYIRYWAKVSCRWSILILMASALCIGEWLLLNSAHVAVLLLVIHVLFSVMGAFAALTNTPFGYLFCGEAFCSLEMSALWVDDRELPPEAEDDQQFDDDQVPAAPTQHEIREMYPQ